MFITMLDSVFSVPPVFDESYYGQVIHEIREANHEYEITRMATNPTRSLPIQLCRST